MYEVDTAPLSMQYGKGDVEIPVLTRVYEVNTAPLSMQYGEGDVEIPVLTHQRVALQVDVVETVVGKNAI